MQIMPHCGQNVGIIFPILVISITCMKPQVGGEPLKKTNVQSYAQKH